jgi:uncharacterized protein (TIGR04255 family)
MVSRGTALPDRIKPDAILEAIFEVRFDAPTILPEVLFGRLAEHSEWKDFQQLRMPAYEIPAPLREADSNLRFAPVFELVRADSLRRVRIGPHVLSYHLMAPYPGWDLFRVELEFAVNELFAKAPALSVKRLGMRYINALREDLHRINSPADLHLNIIVSEDVQLDKVNLNFMTDVVQETQCTIRIATKEFVQGPVASEARVFVDVDVFTTEAFAGTNAAAVKQWAALAHENEKREFFHLLTKQTIQLLEIKGNA